MVVYSDVFTLQIYAHVFCTVYTAKCTAQNTPIHSFSATVIGRIIITSALAIVFSKQ